MQCNAKPDTIYDRYDVRRWAKGALSRFAAGRVDAQTLNEEICDTAHGGGKPYDCEFVTFITTPNTHVTAAEIDKAAESLPLFCLANAHRELNKSDWKERTRYLIDISSGNTSFVFFSYETICQIVAIAWTRFHERLTVQEFSENCLRRSDDTFLTKESTWVECDDVDATQGV